MDYRDESFHLVIREGRAGGDDGLRVVARVILIHDGVVVDRGEASTDEPVHAADAHQWILKSVEATEAQQEEVKAILHNSIDTLLPIAQNHRDYREELRAELAKPTIDRAALESIRESGLGLMDQGVA